MGIDLKEDVVEGGSKVCAVYLSVPGGLGVVDVFAAGAVKLYRLLVGNVGEAHGQQGLGIAVYTGTFAKVALFEFVDL